MLDQIVPMVNASYENMDKVDGIDDFPFPGIWDDTTLTKVLCPRGPGPEQGSLQRFLPAYEAGPGRRTAMLAHFGYYEGEGQQMTMLALPGYEPNRAQPQPTPTPLTEPEILSFQSSPRQSELAYPAEHSVNQDFGEYMSQRMGGMEYRSGIPGDDLDFVDDSRDTEGYTEGYTEEDDEENEYDVDNQYGYGYQDDEDGYNYNRRSPHTYIVSLLIAPSLVTGSHTQVPAGGLTYALICEDCSGYREFSGVPCYGEYAYDDDTDSLILKNRRPGLRYMLAYELEEFTKTCHALQDRRREEAFKKKIRAKIREIRRLYEIDGNILHNHAVSFWEVMVQVAFELGYYSPSSGGSDNLEDVGAGGNGDASDAGDSGYAGDIGDSGDSGDAGGDAVARRRAVIGLMHDYERHEMIGLEAMREVDWDRIERDEYDEPLPLYEEKERTPPPEYEEEERMGASLCRMSKSRYGVSNDERI